MLKVKLFFAVLFLNIPHSICGKKSVLADDNDYHYRPLCGDKAQNPTTNVGQENTCYCGNKTLLTKTDIREGDYYCCVSQSTNGQEQCTYIENNSFDPHDTDVICKNGEVKLKTETCHKTCWNPYRQSKLLYKSATFHCEKEDYCLPLDYMCSGICEDEATFCNPDSLRCIGSGYEIYHYELPKEYKVKYLNNKLGMNHVYCFHQINNDQAYDLLSREDEEKILGTNQPTVNYETLIKSKCETDAGTDGILCSGECKTIVYWCAGTGDVCETDNGAISLDHKDLCRNQTFWMNNNFSCNYLDDNRGVRCLADSKHCIWPWYTNADANPRTSGYEADPWSGRSDAEPVFKTTCDDKSDQVFPINTTCREFNKRFVDSYSAIWCTGEGKQGDWCNYLELFPYWLDDQDLDFDPHGCEKSCKESTTDGADCLACENPEFFHCKSTGYCIHQDLVCDHHPHPSCGGDDEVIYTCSEIYFKRRIVKSYATMVCPSKMYPGKKEYLYDYRRL